jgi:hypothetical protein
MMMLRKTRRIVLQLTTETDLQIQGRTAEVVRKDMNRALIPKTTFPSTSPMPGEGPNLGIP